MKQISRDLMKSGIYCIINISNSKRYVGSSINMYQRLLTHRSELRHNNHGNKKLQSSWNKYGEDLFDFYILEFCDENDLLQREQFYMDSLNSEFNLDRLADRKVRSIESIKLQSETRKRKIESGEIKTNCAKEIFQYSLDGEFIAKHDSIKKAAKANVIHGSGIERFLYGQYKKGGEYLWSYTFRKSMPPYEKAKKDNSFNNKKVVLIDILNNSEIIFESIKDCANHLNLTHSSIRSVLKSGRIYKKQYMIKYIAA